MNLSGRKSTAAFLPAALASFGLVSVAAADAREFAHVHVGGGLSHPPFTFTSTIWYRDIVYDDSAPDVQYTSLDIYTADPVQPGSPVMVFVHGGGFRVGDKAHSKEIDPKPEFFNHKLGYLFVSINYRLLPEGRYPRNVQDVANALAWLHDSIGDFGGDPNQIFLMGHSAGARLVAQVSTDDTFLKNAGKDLTVLKGVIVNDGGYGIQTPDEEAERMSALYGSNWRAALPAANVAAGKGIPPYLFLHVASGSNTALQAKGMAQLLRSAGVQAEVMALDHVEHFGANERVGEPGDLTTGAIEQFLASIADGGRPAGWIESPRLGR